MMLCQILWKVAVGQSSVHAACHFCCEAAVPTAVVRSGDEQMKKYRIPYCVVNMEFWLDP